MQWPESKGRTCWLVLALGILLIAAAGVGSAQQADGGKGELRIEGTNISRLVLAGKDNVPQEWSNLSGSVSLPVGIYGVQRIELQGGYSTYSPGDLTKVTISADKPTVLKAGGPLRQTVRIERRGSALVLNYELIGIGDERYMSANRSLTPPSFTVYRGDKAVASGRFEYG
jgi:hypothetical protein